MARLIGAQRMVLHAILDLPKDGAGFVKDSQIAESSQIALTDVRDWIETLEGGGYIEVAKANDGLRAFIKAEGRLALGLYQPVKATQPPPISAATSPPASLGGSSGPQPA